MRKVDEKKIFLFTSEFPYGNSETYLESEIPVLTERFDEIFIFPSKCKGEQRNVLPPKFKVVCLDDDWIKQRYKLFWGNFFLLIKTLFNEFRFTPSKLEFLRNIKKFKNLFLHKLYLANQLSLILGNKATVGSSVFCSYWFSNWVITLGILKYRGVIDSFVSRAHGFDIYDNRYKDGYIPFRFFQLKMVDKVFSVSNKGNQYLKGKNIFQDKIETSYLGVQDSGTNPFDKDTVFTLVSCSNVNTFKRLDLIVEILKHISFPVKWVHFGDGDQLEKLKDSCRQLPASISVDFKGRVTNQQVMDFYRENSISLFITTSAMEGLPMTLIEAASFGIPLMGTNVGGIPEIINENSGILIPENVDVVAAADLINEFNFSEKNTLAFREKVKLQWTLNFEAKTNYNRFYDSITNIKKGQ